MKYVEIRELGEIVTGKTPPTENLDFMVENILL